MPKDPKRTRQLGRDDTQAQMVHICPKIRKRKKSTFQIHRHVLGLPPRLLMKSTSPSPWGVVNWLVKNNKAF
jgi:hypothetical protein